MGESALKDLGVEDGEVVCGSVLIGYVDADERQETSRWSSDEPLRGHWWTGGFEGQ